MRQNKTGKVNELTFPVPFNINRSQYSTLNAFKKTKTYTAIFQSLLRFEPLLKLPQVETQSTVPASLILLSVENRSLFTDIAE